jgi:hypothetical protein
LAASDDFDYPFWNATAELGDNPNNYQQVFVARVPADYEPPFLGEIFIPVLVKN